jgi:RecA-family ATPase
MFKIFPCGADKIPLIRNWQTEATDDPEVHRMWANLHREKFVYWGVPTGIANDIFVLDVDVKKENGHEELKKYPMPKTLTQRTPSGGMHYIFKYPQDGKKYGNRVKFLPGLDTRGDGGYIIWYGGDDTPPGETPTWLREKASPSHNQISQAASQSTIKVAPEIAAEVVQKSLDNIREAPEGESNNVLNVESFKLGQLVASQSITRDYAEQALFRAAKDRGKPDYEAKATITSGLDGGSKKPIPDPFNASAPIANVPIPDPRGTLWTPSKTTREEIMDFTKLRKPQLFENWSTEDIAITTADGGTGKTTLKLFEAICLALGERFLGFRCIKPGKTLFITGEDTDSKLKAMLGQILRQMGLTESSEYDDKVQTVLDSIYIKKDADLCLIVKEPRSSFLLPSAQAMERVMQAVDHIRPKMIVFDPISAFWGSEAMLNDMAKAVTKFMSELAERSGASVEMINHMGKQASSNKDMSQFAGRGGTGLPSHARVSRTLRAIFDEEYTELTMETLGEKQSAMLCNVNKFSDGSPLYNKPFLILRDGFLFTRKFMTDAKAREAEEKLSDVERVFQFIQETRESNRYASRNVVLAHFKTCGNPIAKPRVEATLHMLEFDGHMGERIKFIENPNQLDGGKVYTITDMDGKE